MEAPKIEDGEGRRREMGDRGRVRICSKMGREFNKQKHDSWKEMEGREDKGNCGKLKCLRVFVTLRPPLNGKGNLVQQGIFYAK